MTPHASHVVTDISDVSPRFDLVCGICQRTDNELIDRCPVPFDVQAWNLHLRQIIEHIDAMERHARRTEDAQFAALNVTINRLRKRVEDSKI
ncbi:hypothetical protein LAV_00161 [Sphingobium phage Lacusarx]|uniref:Uncharacterized protein n=1 Tax=Sphingobium phage Lacusarx TaxID=1980139 RepID=A0A1W6DXE8_9CAUD|nr:hypothetical protein FDH44_gp142 [Sphingobium phage Lacusarx]ARK07536.1 hypothetical protein LAV_00161 [Sphingobium phage Lacusarx]